MNFCKVKKLFGIMCACAFFSVTGHQVVFAAPAEGTEAAVVAEEAEEAAEAEETAETAAAETEAAEETAESWVAHTAEELEGYLQEQSSALLTKVGTAVEEAAAAAEVFMNEQEMLELRQDMVDYALSFVGGRYVWGGTDPHTGVDCSGFTRYVIQNTAGISMNRSSVYQATQGTQVSAEEMQPGDLIFYGKGKRINHVAMYIGDGQVVHASSEKTGIKTSPWNYRTPMKIVSVLG